MREGEGHAPKEALSALRFFRALCDGFPDGLVVVDLNGEITRVNARLEQMTGFSRDEIVGRPIETLIPERFRHAHLEKRARHTAEPLTRPMGAGLSLFLLRKDGTELAVDIGLSPVETDEGRLITAAVRDDTIRRQAEDRVREAEIRYRYLVEGIPVTTHMSRLDATSSTIYMSPQVEAMSGYSPAEWESDPNMWVNVLHPEDRTRALEANERLITTGAPMRLEYRMVARDGRTVWVEENTSVIRDENGLPVHAQGFLKDITERKQAEAELAESFKLLHRTDQERRRLVAHLVHAQEDERTRIASDIHDDPLQKVTAVGLRLEMLKRDLPDAQDWERVGEIERIVALAGESLRHLIFEVRPLALDREGLAAALREYLEQAAGDTGFEFTLQDDLREAPTPECGLVCYRLAQEAIANVRSHSQAKQVRVTLASEGAGVRMTINDDGVGFSPDTLPDAPGHLGLHDMRERAELVGGWLRIESEPGAGAVVEFWVPCAAPAS